MIAIILVFICLIWLVMGLFQFHKANKSNNGIPVGVAMGLLVFFFLPAFMGLLIGIILLRIN